MEVKVEIDLRSLFDPDLGFQCINPNEKTVEHRGGAIWNGKYFQVLSIFTIAFRRWQYSGQNDNGEDILFHRFCPREAGGMEISTEEKMVTILFYAFKAYSPDKMDVEVFNFSSKNRPKTLRRRNFELAFSSGCRSRRTKLVMETIVTAAKKISKLIAGVLIFKETRCP